MTLGGRRRSPHCARPRARAMRRSPPRRRRPPRTSTTRARMPSGAPAQRAPPPHPPSPGCCAMSPGAGGSHSHPMRQQTPDLAHLLTPSQACVLGIHPLHARPTHPCTTLLLTALLCARFVACTSSLTAGSLASLPRPPRRAARAEQALRAPEPYPACRSQEKEAELEELRREVRRLEARVRASHRDLQAQADKAELQRRFAAAAQARSRPAPGLHAGGPGHRGRGQAWHRYPAALGCGQPVL